jgi:predicted ester cyclase
MAVVISIEGNKAGMYRLVEEVFNKGDITALDEICTPNCVLEAPGVPSEKGIQEGVEAFKQRITSFRNAFPDIQYTIDDTVAEGNMVAIGYSFRGTHKGEFAGIIPTGKQVKVTELCFAHLTDGKVERLRFCPYGTNIMQLLRG